MLSELSGKGNFKNQIVYHDDFECGGFVISGLGDGGQTNIDAEGKELPEGQRVLHFHERAAHRQKGERIRIEFSEGLWMVVAIANLGVKTHEYAGFIESANGFGYLVKPV